jgi:hypothetical protein
LSARGLLFGPAGPEPVAAGEVHMRNRNLLDLLADQIADAETAWSLGTFGAIAEFTRDADEAAVIARAGDGVVVVTARGGICIKTGAGPRAIASESLTPGAWNQRVALCLPQSACAMSARTVLTEVGLDGDALRAEDRAAALFDLGLGALQIDACVRSADPEVVAALRNCAGTSLFAAGNGAMRVILASNPHRVFISRIGRIEIYQPIPPPGGKSPDGPHTHVLPKLLRSGRTHAATEPLPAGWIPGAHFYPPNPLRDGSGSSRPFRPECHDAFQTLLSRYGDPRLVEIKDRVVDAVRAGEQPSMVRLPEDRYGRATVRVTLRQLRATERMSAALAAWLAAHDRFDPDRPEPGP